MDELSPEQPVIRDVVLDVQLPQSTPTSPVQVRRIRMLPDFPAGLHIHKGPVVGSILEGSVVYQVEGEPQAALVPGDVFYPREGARIARFDAGAEGVTFLAYFLLRAGQEPAIEFPSE